MVAFMKRFRAHLCTWTASGAVLENIWNTHWIHMLAITFCICSYICIPFLDAAVGIFRMPAIVCDEIQWRTWFQIMLESTGVDFSGIRFDIYFADNGNYKIIIIIITSIYVRITRYITCTKFKWIICIDSKSDRCWVKLLLSSNDKIDTAKQSHNDAGGYCKINTPHIYNNLTFIGTDSARLMKNCQLRGEKLTRWPNEPLAR